MLTPIETHSSENRTMTVCLMFKLFCGNIYLNLMSTTYFKKVGTSIYYIFTSPFLSTKHDKSLGTEEINC